MSQSKAISLDAPVEGWNAFHGLDDMPPTAAIVLDNLIPGTGSVKTREGYVVYADTGTGRSFGQFVDVCGRADPYWGLGMHAGPFYGGPYQIGRVLPYHFGVCVGDKSGRQQPARHRAERFAGVAAGLDW